MSKISVKRKHLSLLLDAPLQTLLFITVSHFKITVAAIITIIIILQFIDLYMVNNLALEGSKEYELTQSIEDYTLQNQILRYQIAKQASLKTIESEAYKRGFVPANTIFFTR